MKILECTDKDICFLLLSSIRFFVGEENLIIQCLHAIKHLVILDENYMNVEVFNNPFLCKEKILRYDIEGILLSYINTQNKELYEIVDYLIEEFNLKSFNI